jgi:hypothetical protein
MGPLLLLDKNVIQGLSYEEILTMRNHYTGVICPILIQEIIGNLLLGSDAEEASEKNVKSLASKSHGFDVRTIPYYKFLENSDLINGNVSINPCIPRINGKQIVGKNDEVINFYPESMEEKLLKKWGIGEFDNLDKEYSEIHKEYKEINLEGLKKELQEIMPVGFHLGSMGEIIHYVDENLSIPKDQWKLIEKVCKQNGFTEQTIEQVFARWKSKGSPTFKDFSPYSFYCERLENIFNMGIVFNLIKTSKSEKTWIDREYLYYLPFVNCFCSGDNFLKDFSRIFLRSDQMFVGLNELKNDLKKIRFYMSKLTPEEGKNYSVDRGSYPPDLEESVTNKIWKKYRPPWTPGSGNQVSVMTKEEKEKSIKEAKEFFERIHGTTDGDLNLLEVKYLDSIDEFL